MIVKGSTEGYGRRPRMPRRLQYGRKTHCGISGFATYEGRLLTDDYNQKYDPRFADGDVKADKTH